MTMRTRHLVVVFAVIAQCVCGPTLRADDPDASDAQATEKSTKATIQSPLTADGSGGAEEGESGGGAAGGEVRGAPASVGRSGALSQSVPITVLPGRAGMTPALQLVYSSDNHHNGWLGFGWDLNVGTLVRKGARGQSLSPNSYNPKSFFPTDNWKNERYQLSVWGHGQELIYDPAHSDGAMVRFAPRYQSHWKIEAPANANDFDQWQATDPGGNVYAFSSKVGAGAGDKRNVQYLTKITSLHHTNLFIEYGVGTPYLLGGIDIGSRAVYPVTIAYSCETMSAPCYRVQFVWEDRGDRILDASSGVLVAWTKRLKEIRVETPTGQVAWKYLFTYKTDPYNQWSLLQSVGRVDGAGAPLLPPATFLYQQNGVPTGEWKTQKTVLDPITYLLPGDGDGVLYRQDGGTFFADLNADGLPDQVQRFASTKTGGVADWMNQGNGQFNNALPKQEFGFTAAVKFGDQNGDGLLDIWKNGAAPGNDGGPMALKDGVSDLHGNALAPAAKLPVAFYDLAKQDQGVQILDINGDGYADLLQGLRLNSGSHTRAAWLFDPTTQSYQIRPEWAPPVDFVAYNKPTGVQSADFNGDGLVDLYHMTALDPSNNGIYLNTGSGWLNATELFSVEWSKGFGGWIKEEAGLIVNGKWYPKMRDAKGNDIGWHFVDINGDHLVDLVASVDYFGNAVTHVLLATADQRWVAQDNVTVPAALTKYFHSAQRYKHAYKYFLGQDTGARFVDIDGDTLPDLIQVAGPPNFAATGVVGYEGVIWKNPLPRPAGLLVAAHSPLGAWSAFQYAAYATPGDKIGAPRIVVQRTEVHNTNGALIDATEYAYAQPNLIDAASPEYVPSRGAEFLGFSSIVRTEIGYAALMSASGSYTPGKPSSPMQVTALKETAEDGRRRTTTTYLAGYAMVGQVAASALESSNDKGKTWMPIHKVKHTYHDTAHAGVSLMPPYRSLVKTVTEQFLEGAPVTVVHQYPKHTVFGDPLVIMHEGRTDIAGDETTVERNYYYDAKNWLFSLPISVKITDGGEWRSSANTYDALGRLATSTVTASKVDGAVTTSYTRDDYGNVLTSVTIGGAAPLTTAIVYDAVYHQWPVQTTNPLGHIAKATYYGVNAAEPLSAPAAFGRVARRYSLAAAGVAAAAYVQSHYDNFGRPMNLYTKDTATNGVLAHRWWTYTPHIDTGQYETRIWEFGATSELLGSTIVTLDAIGRVIQGKRQRGNGWLQTDVEYGPYSSIARVSDPHQSNDPITWTTTSVDASGRPWATTHAGQTTSYEYERFLTRVFDGKGHMVEEERDAQGRLIRAVDEGNAVTKIAYGSAIGNAAGAQPAVTIQGPDNTVTLIYQDGLGRIRQRVDPDRGTWTWNYDSLGRLLQQKNGKGEIVQFAYDTVGRTIGIDGNADGVTEIQFYYDGKTPTTTKVTANALGRRSAMVDPSGSTTWVYNVRGAPTWIAKSVGPDKYGLALSYDLLGRVTESRYSQATLWTFPTPLFAVRYQQTIDGLRRVEYQIGSATTWTDAVADVVYDPRGRAAAVHYGNGTTGQYTYNFATGRLTGYQVAKTNQGTEKLLDLAYTYQAGTGEITAITDVLNPQFTQNFTYDQRGWLATAKSPAYGERFYYAGSSGNLENNGPWTLHYDPARPHAVKWADNSDTKQTVQYVYDGNGNATNAAGTVVLYNSLLQIHQIQSALGLTTLTYDGDGQRVKQAITMAQQPAPSKPAPVVALTTPPPSKGAAAGSAPTKLIMDMASAAWLPSGPTQLITLPFPTMEVLEEEKKGMTRAKPTFRYHIGALGQRVATIEVNAKGVATPKYFYADHLGSASVVADKIGQIILGSVMPDPKALLPGTPYSAKHLHYAPYGIPFDAAGIALWNTWPDPTHTYVGASSVPMAQLYLTGPRLYDPVLGRFLQPDPIPGSVLSPQARNPYAYARNNPIMFRDPSGLQAVGIGETMEVGEGSPTGFSLSGSYSSAGGNHQSQFSGAPDATNYGTHSGSGHGYAKNAAGNAASTPSGAQPYVDYGMMYQPDPLFTDPYHEGRMAGNPDMQHWAISQSKAMDLVVDTLTNYGLGPDAVPNIEFWPELGAVEGSLGLYDPYGQYGYGSDGNHQGYGNPTIYLGGITQDASTVLHELGHHMDLMLNVLNTSGALDTEFVADMFALGEMDRRGMMPTTGALGYGASYSGGYIAFAKCGGNLAHCSGFWNALVDGDASFFSADTRIPFMQPKYQEKYNSFINQ